MITWKELEAGASVELEKLKEQNVIVNERHIEKIIREILSKEGFKRPMFGMFISSTHNTIKFENEVVIRFRRKKKKFSLSSFGGWGFEEKMTIDSLDFAYNKGTVNEWLENLKEQEKAEKERQKSAIENRANDFIKLLNDSSMDIQTFQKLEAIYREHKVQEKIFEKL